MRKYFPHEKDLDGFNEFIPSDHIPVAGLPDAIRDQKSAWLNTISVRAVFSAEVEDGDLVVPVVRDDVNDWYHPDTVWVPALGPDAVMHAETETGATYQPKFYGMAYKGINRVMLGPLVYHPTYKFRAGDILYATANGKMTTEQTEVFVGACLAPGYVLLHGTAQNIDLFKKAAELTDRAETAASTSVEMADRVVEEGEAQIKRMEDLAEQLLIIGVSYNKYAVADISEQTAEGTQIALPEYEGTQMSYIVGSNTLLLCYNGTWMLPGEQYTEVGAAGLPSAVIQLNQELRPGDKLGVLILSQYTKVLLSVDSGLGFKENGELYIAPVTAEGTTTARPLAERFADIANVRDFGAVGDGVTDDTAAFEAAAATGKTVFVPEGQYKLSQKVAGTFISTGKAACDTLNVLNLPDVSKDIKNTRTAGRAHQLSQYAGFAYQLFDYLGEANWMPGVTVEDFIPDPFDPDVCYVQVADKRSGAEVDYIKKLIWDTAKGGFVVVASTAATTLIGHQGCSIYRPTPASPARFFTYDNFKLTLCRWDEVDGTEAVIERVWDVLDSSLLQQTGMERPGFADVIFAGISPKVSEDHRKVVCRCVRKSDSKVIFRVWDIERLLASPSADQTTTYELSVEEPDWGVWKTNTTYDITRQSYAFDGQNFYCLDSHIGNSSHYIKVFDVDGTVVLERAATKEGKIEDPEMRSYEGESLSWGKNRHGVPTLFLSVSVFDAMTEGITVKHNYVYDLFDSSPKGWPLRVQSWDSNIRIDNDTLTIKNGALVLSRTSDSARVLNFLYYGVEQGGVLLTQNYVEIRSNTSALRLGVNSAQEDYPALRFLGSNESAYYSLYPEKDGVMMMGRGSNRWSQVYAATDAINTSDAREKVNLSDPDEALMRAWGKVNFKAFQFADAVGKKGEDARIHFGVIAQQVAEAFASEGLDASRYALFCYDKWEDEYEEQEDGTKVLGTPAGDRYGIRYAEALALECAYQRWLGEKREQRIAKLEALMGVTNG